MYYKPWPKDPGLGRDLLVLGVAGHLLYMYRFGGECGSFCVFGSALRPNPEQFSSYIDPQLLVHLLVKMCVSSHPPMQDL